MIEMLYIPRWRRRLGWSILALFGLPLLIAGFVGLRSGSGDNTTAGVTFLVIGLAVCPLALFKALTAPKKTRKLERLEAMDPVTSEMQSWLTHRTRRNGIVEEFHAVAIRSGDKLYFASNVGAKRVALMQQASENHQLINLIESGLTVDLSRRFKRFEPSDIRTIETSQGKLVIHSREGAKEFTIRNNANVIARDLAAAVLPGAAAVIPSGGAAKPSGKIATALGRSTQSVVFNRTG